MHKYLRNDAMDPPCSFATIIDGAKVTPELGYESLERERGGPIRRTKTFVFAAYEGTRRRTASTTALTVPTNLQRAGDFSRTLTSTGALIPIYNPDTEPKLPFAGNVIPANRLDPVALTLMNYFPRPNRTPSSITGANNFPGQQRHRSYGRFSVG